MKRKVIGILLIVIGIVSFLVIHFTSNNKEIIKLSKEYYKEEKGSLIEIKANELPKNKNYILFTYNSYCSFPVPCDEVFKEFAENEKIDIVAIPFKEYKKTKLYPKVKYAPSVLIIKNNKIISYLDANSDNDKDCYQNVEIFTAWVKKHVELINE